MKTLIFVVSAIALASSQYHGYHHAIYPQHIPVIDHNGVPVDTPEVQAARASHLAALSAASHGHHANHYTAPFVYNGYYGNAYAHHAVPVIAPDGTPLDTPEVQHAKSAHFAAYNEAAARNGVQHGAIDTPEVQHAKAAHFAAHAQALHHNRYRRALFFSYPYTHYPLIGHNGAPVETPEVQAAKAHHFAAHAEAHYRNAVSPFDYTHERYAAQVPLDTPEVQHAKAEHFAAHAEANARNHFGGHYGAVVPADTPEVHLAKLKHFAAHEEARSHHY